MTPPRAILTLRREPAYRRDAFANGLKRLGYDVVCGTAGDRTVHPRSRDDLLVLWNLKAGLEERAAERWEFLGGTVLVIENAYLQQVDKSAYTISTHGHNGEGWFPLFGGDDRFTPLGFDLKPMQDNPNGHILVCGQRGVGSARMASPPRWGDLIAKQTHGSRFRPHPGNMRPRVPLTDDLRGAKRCLIWSSAAGVQALVEGIPVGHAAPHWICEGWEDDRRTALNRMAHNQWHHDEIASGEPFARMRDRDWGPSWV